MVITMDSMKVATVEEYVTTVCFVVSCLKLYQLNAATAMRLKYSSVSIISIKDFLYTLEPMIQLSRKRQTINTTVVNREI